MITDRKKMLVTGGTGLVGRHLKDILPDAIYVSSSEYELTHLDSVHAMMECHRPDIVVHLAARVGGIEDNLKYPVDYLEENIMMNTNVLKKCHEFNVSTVVGVLSTCIYPDEVSSYPMKEKDLFAGPPAPSNFSYGISKRCMAVQIDSYNKQYGVKWGYLIPCNLYGEYDKYTEHNSHFVAALIKKIHEAKEYIELWGTGEPLRQFMYGGDLARVIKYLISNEIVGNFNVAPSEVHTINEMAHIAKIACGKEKLKIVYDSSRPDGQFRKDVDSSKLLKELGNFQFLSLSAGIERTYSKIKLQDPLFREPR